MGKRNNLMTIGEVAKSIGISRRMILYYEDRGLVVPDTKDGPTGNRYFTVDTLTRIRTIRILSDIGLSLDEVRMYFDDRSDLRPVLARLESVRDELGLSIEKLRERIGNGEHGAVVYATIPGQTIYSRAVRSDNIEEKKETLRLVMFDAISKYGSDVGKRMLFLEHLLDDPEESCYCVAVPAGSTGDCIRVLPEARAIMITHHGAYEGLPEVKRRLLEYAREKGLEPLGVCRHIYLEGPPQHSNPENFITQVAILIADRRKS